MVQFLARSAYVKVSLGETLKSKQLVIYSKCRLIIIYTIFLVVQHRHSDCSAVMCCVFGSLTPVHHNSDQFIIKQHIIVCFRQKL